MSFAWETARKEFHGFFFAFPGFASVDALGVEISKTLITKLLTPNELKEMKSTENFTKDSMGRKVRRNKRREALSKQASHMGNRPGKRGYHDTSGMQVRDPRPLRRRWMAGARIDSNPRRMKVLNYLVTRIPFSFEWAFAFFFLIRFQSVFSSTALSIHIFHPSHFHP
jgi:hypothetical protein